jgi:hypothetical protein
MVLAAAFLEVRFPHLDADTLYREVEILSESIQQTIEGHLDDMEDREKEEDASRDEVPHDITGAL